MANNGKEYIVRLVNMCADPTPHGPCSFEWEHFQEVKRNDFHHHRDALVLRGSDAKYSVVLAERPTLARMSDKPKTGSDWHLFNTDAAPCMGAGYGGGNGP